MSSCFGGHDEQIYLIEVLIDTLTLTPEKVKEIGAHPIVIKVKLLDLPVFEITREGKDAAPKPGRDGAFRFAIGRCSLFVKRPRELVHGLRSTSLRAGVFRAGDTYPTGDTAVTVPGCLCDQIAMVDNDPANPPKPFAVKGGFHLLDPGQHPSGTLHMELTIACLGRVCAILHELRPKSLVPDEQSGERELCVRRYVPPEFIEDPREKELAPTPEAAKPPIDKKGKKDKAAGTKKKKRKGG